MLTLDNVSVNYGAIEALTGISMHLETGEQVTLVGKGMSMSPEGRGVFSNLSVRENLQMGAYLKKDKRAIAADMERAFQMFPRLKERESQKAGTLSGGE